MVAAERTETGISSKLASTQTKGPLFMLRTLVGHYLFHDFVAFEILSREDQVMRRSSTLLILKCERQYICCSHFVERSR
jgi:hypothetical protein